MLILILSSIAELIKRVIGVVLYPLAYWFREWARTNQAGSWCAFALWLALDDTIHFEGLKMYGQSIDYCAYGKREPLDWITERLKDGPFKEFARSYNWSAVRNSVINFMVLTEGWIGNRVSVISRKEWGKSFYEVRQFSSGIKLPYLEYWIGGFRIQCGFLQCGRFQQGIIRKI